MTATGRNNIRPQIAFLNRDFTFKTNLFMWLDQLGLVGNMTERLAAYKERIYQVRVNR